MSYTSDRARFESELAKAHRALTYARDAAERLQSSGDVEDLVQIRNEVTRLAEGSLRGKARPVRQIKGQQQLPDNVPF
jgi:hypothetical protein